MSVGIAGMGWVTPLGTGLEEVWAQVRDGVRPEVKTLTNPETGRALAFIPTPPSAVAHLARNPRLRRSSAISALAVAAGLSALENAGGAIPRERTAVVFAICDGGVLYTRKFYEQIVKDGANVASPLLFPETVYNAPASHLAALLGIDGASYTLVGDSSVGMSALHFAAELLETSDIEQVVVVGAEECDWILCEAYRHWRLASTPLAEGAAALVLQHGGRWKLHTHPGAPFARRRDAGSALASVLTHFADAKVRRIVASANGTFIDRAEADALALHFPNIPILALKISLGESPGAGALMQTVLAALTGGSALVTVVGFNHQCGAALVSGE
ncbi:MAG: beta-ketoacyl synthase N-terminal-like domain-containing protein [Chthoniobacteraceae bacterium]